MIQIVPIGKGNSSRVFRLRPIHWGIRQSGQASEAGDGNLTLFGAILFLRVDETFGDGLPDDNFEELIENGDLDEPTERLSYREFLELRRQYLADWVHPSELGSEPLRSAKLAQTSPTVRTTTSRVIPVLIGGSTILTILFAVLVLGSVPIQRDYVAHHGKTSTTSTSKRYKFRFTTMSRPDTGTQEIYKVIAPGSDVPSVGSAIAIDPDGDLVTADQLVGPTTSRLQIQLTNSGTKSIYEPATVIGVDPLSGIAVVRMNNAPRNSLKGVLPVQYEAQVGQHYKVEYFSSQYESQAVSSTGAVLSTNEVTQMPDGSAFVATELSTTSVDPMLGAVILNSQNQVQGLVTRAFKFGSMGSVLVVTPTPVIIKDGEQIVSNGTVAGGSIGVTCIQAHWLNTSYPAVLVQSVTPGGPGQLAGIQPGDVVVSIQGSPVDSSSEYEALIGLEPPGTVLEMTIIRNGNLLPEFVTVGQQESLPGS